MNEPDHLEQLKVLPKDLEVLVPSGFRWYVVETVEDAKGRTMTLHSKYHTEAEARTAAAGVFKIERGNYKGVLYGVGVIDMNDPSYMHTQEISFIQV